MKRILIIIVSCLAVVSLGIGAYLYFKPDTEEDFNLLKPTDGVEVVPTMMDKIAGDYVWCPTFQLIWNDLKNEIVGEDINLKLDIVKNLNKEEFKESMLSDNYYYKKVGLKTIALKNEIEDAIYKKFEEKSDILDNFDWSDDALDQGLSNKQRYFLYAMLFHKFNFEYRFEKLDNDTFKDTKDVKYFGTNGYSNYKIKRQVVVLYYNNENDYAIKIKTKENDEVILVMNPRGNTFKEIYDNMNRSNKEFTDSTYLRDDDRVKVPYLSMNVLKSYSELENQVFYNKNGEEFEIVKAMQTVKFTLNEKGGKIKSEAGMDVNKVTSVPDKVEPRYFYFNNTFAIFLKEENKKLPYFAGLIDDITKFQ